MLHARVNEILFLSTYVVPAYIYIIKKKMSEKTNDVARNKLKSFPRVK